MSYQVLARKWRPRTFREMVGQTHVLKALINALDNQRLHHAYLFTGTRGVGKTTIARILAKCLNCETGIGSTPCGQCSVCREVDEGRFVDLIEVDAASRTKVEDTRELLDNVQYAPTRGRYKVYLIDEVHMLSSHSFNALLKTLEEPPPHVKFLLATTDPQKLPVTVLSRCLQFSLKNMPPERVVEHLTHVLTAEQVPFEPEALWQLGRAADGSMRDAMSLTDQAIAFGEGKVLADDVRAMLGTLDHGQVYGVLQALLERDARGLLAAIRTLGDESPDWNAVLAEILNVLHRVAIAQVLPDALDNGQGDREQVLALAQALPGEDVQYYYQMALIGRRDLPLAPDPRSGFEMALLRMLAFRPGDADEAPPSIELKPLGIAQATPDSQSSQVAGVVAAAPVVALAAASLEQAGTSGQGRATSDAATLPGNLNAVGAASEATGAAALADHLPRETEQTVAPSGHGVAGQGAGDLPGEDAPTDPGSQEPEQAYSRTAPTSPARDSTGEKTPADPTPRNAELTPTPTDPLDSVEGASDLPWEDAPIDPTARGSSTVMADTPVPAEPVLNDLPAGETSSALGTQAQPDRDPPLQTSAPQGENDHAVATADRSVGSPTPDAEHLPQPAPSASAQSTAKDSGAAAPKTTDEEAVAVVQPVSTQLSDATLAPVVEDDTDDEEPPPGDDYYEVDMDSYAYLDEVGTSATADQPEAIVLPDVPPATGLAAQWQEIFPQLGLAGMTGSIAANCTLAAIEGDVWHLQLDPNHSALFNANQERRLADALNQFHGQPIQLRVVVEKPAQETPAQAATRRKALRQREAEAAIQNDPLVRQMIEQFAAVVRDGTIEPLDAQG